MTNSRSRNSTVEALAIAAIAAQVLFVGGWLIGGAIEGHGYSAGRQDISDLTALTAHHATFNRTTLLVSGLLTAAFAFWALRPSLTSRDLRAPNSAWLVALSLPSLDNLSDVFFRLDCRAADAGCSASHAAASWHGKIHLVMFAIAALATVIAPFALAHRMQKLDGWRSVAGPARLFGVLVVAALFAAGALGGTAAQGSSQRIAATLIPLGIVGLALHVRRQAANSTGSAGADATDQPSDPSPGVPSPIDVHRG